MNKKMTSSVSIEQTIDEQDRSHAFLSRDEYLKTQCQIRENALRTAQNLIQAYQKQNEDLKEENLRLKQILNDKEHNFAFLQQKQDDIKLLQQNLLHYSQRTNELLQLNIENERKVKSLERQIEAVHQNYQAQQQSKRMRDKLKHSEDKQRKEVQKHFKNYLKFPAQDRLESASKNQRTHDPSNSLFTPKSQLEEKGKQHNEIKVLSWKLKQKDEEILILLKRLRDMEARVEHMHLKFNRERIVTSDTVDDYITKKNISQFCN